LILKPDESALASRPSVLGRAPAPRARRSYTRIGLGVAVTDAVAVVAALALIRFGNFGVRRLDGAFLRLLAVGAGAWLGIAAMLRLYRISRLSPAEEFRRLVEAAGLFTGVGLLFGGLMGGSVVRILAKGTLFQVSALALVLILTTRQIWHKWMGRQRAEGRLVYRTLIVGANEEGVRIAATLGPRPFLGFQPVGFLETGSVSADLDGLPVLGAAEDFTEVIEDNGIECVFVAASAMTPQLMRETTRALRRMKIEVRVSANLTEILSSRLTVQPVGDLLALSLHPVRLSGGQAIAKRAFDLVTGATAIVVTTPIWLLSALMIMATSRGPVFFRQERVGRGGRTFTMYKFRTMVQGAEAMLPTLQPLNEASGPLFKIRLDPRITRVGRFLRRYSIDELPQLINVMRGEMSLVGPRPPLPKEVAIYEEWHRDRLEVKPGITGLWQVGGRSELSFDDYVRLDLFYIENWSILYDVFLLAKTVPAVLIRKGAF
jgi:exopolysaccharide biosynthesis polyprenyl glycosylphosphotransferase